ncbi:Single-stranded DNA-binding protein (Helix-destabilizing protein),Helix-destabilizing protein,single-stranded DNA-binding protein,single-stranded DNA-binding protein,Single-strand binding protein family [[Clostridium] sordellii]|uniref:single-stranded DNA-binding protein n=1 Tax=Paraclostridium sordellii TaxID=1505 RepID=UPI00054221EB|nr:single-stranded DNA-binding protein [Paeniclostridium sordellii]CEK34334.1 Single-stranded DNA-binding protein (Helix-destabilizing protein),Helix-destabilizing protein,single-stranded DNA-binding protein,single-stranded DNA-binding protein,Single-strand binding protein family [[Clostridium] sordellii] [Paeniclostridium sordellii]
MNSVCLVGRLTKDPELRYIPGSGTAVASFTIAIDRDYFKKDGSKDTDFIPVEIMGKPAEYTASYITKGGLVSITGSIRVDKWQDQNGEGKIYTKVRAKTIKSLINKSKKENEKPSFEAADKEENPFEEW